MYNSVFQKQWWLDAVAPGKWDMVKITNGSEIVARMPYTIEKKMGLTALTQPLLTPVLGPWLKDTNAKPSKQLSSQKELIWGLLDQLPKHDLFSQSLHVSITNWLPFYWKGFEQTTKYTYILDDLKDLDSVWNGFSEQARRNIRKAGNKVRIRTDLDVGRFFELNTKTFQRQGRNPPYTRDFIERVDEACAHEHARQIFFAEDASGNLHSAIYVLWDETAAYYLMGGEDPDFRNSEASSLLIWEAIQFVSKITKQFDFEGSMIQSIERFFRSFGAKQVPYFHITGMSKRMKAIYHGRSIFRDILKS